MAHWKCQECDALNPYPEVKECESCAHEITDDEVAAAIKAIADEEARRKDDEVAAVIKAIADVEARRKEEEQRKREEEARIKAEAERRKREAEAKRKAEEQRKKREEKDAIKIQAEDELHQRQKREKQIQEEDLERERKEQENEDWNKTIEEIGEILEKSSKEQSIELKSTIPTERGENEDNIKYETIDETVAEECDEVEFPEDCFKDDTIDDIADKPIEKEINWYARLIIAGLIIALIIIIVDAYI